MYLDLGRGLSGFSVYLVQISECLSFDSHPGVGLAVLVGPNSVFVNFCYILGCRHLRFTSA
jgi:hypothetical protein